MAPPLMGVLYLLLRAFGVIKLKSGFFDALASALAIQIPIEYFLHDFVWNLVCALEPITKAVWQLQGTYTSCKPALPSGAYLIPNILWNILGMNLVAFLLPTVLLTVTLFVGLKLFTR